MNTDTPLSPRLPQILLLDVGFECHDGDRNLRNISSPFTRLYYVVEGEGEIICESGSVKLTPGHMYIIPAFMRHSNIGKGIFNHYYIHLYEDGAEGAGFLEELDIPFEIEDTDGDLRLFRRICNLSEPLSLNKERPLHQRMEAAGIIYQLLSRFVGRSKPKYETADPRVRMALRYLHDNLCDDIPLERLAGEACLSRDHFIKIFNREIGCSPIRYIIRQRMMRAQLLLASSDKPVKAIALQLGYNDFSYFSRLFKKHSGFSPLQYRETFNRQ